MRLPCADLSQIGVTKTLRTFQAVIICLPMILNTDINGVSTSIALKVGKARQVTGDMGQGTWNMGQLTCDICAELGVSRVSTIRLCQPTKAMLLLTQPLIIERSPDKT